MEIWVVGIGYVIMGMPCVLFPVLGIKTNPYSMRIHKSLWFAGSTILILYGIRRDIGLPDVIDAFITLLVMLVGVITVYILNTLLIDSETVKKTKSKRGKKS